MSHLLASLALLFTIVILMAIIGYIKYHDSYRQYCLQTARANYLIEEDGERAYRDALEDERIARKKASALLG